MRKEHLPRSSTARFSERWQASVGDENFLEQVVDRWRTAGLGSADSISGMAMFAEAMGLATHESETAAAPSPEGRPAQRSAEAERSAGAQQGRAREGAPQARVGQPGAGQQPLRTDPMQRPSAAPGAGGLRRPMASGQSAPPQPGAGQAGVDQGQQGGSLKNLRDRLMQRR